MRYFFLFVTFLYALQSSAQNPTENLTAEIVDFDIPKSIYISGERLWVSIDISSKNEKVKSQIGYVEILNRNNQSVALGKFQLTDGKTINFLNLPNDIPSDHYLIRVFTRISPYLDFELGLRQKLITVVNPRIPPTVSPAPDKMEQGTEASGNETILAQRNQNELELDLTGVNGEIISASVSVANPYLTHYDFSSSDIYESLPSRNLVPELFGHIVEGYVNPKAIDTTQLYFISVHGEKSALFTDRPDRNGSLYFDTGGIKEWDFIIAQTNGNESLIDFSVVSPSPQTSFSEDFIFPEFIISPDDEEFLNELLKSSQVEQYFVQDFSSTANPVVTGFVEDRTYLLDDYTRFETVETVVKEYVPEVSVRTQDKKKDFRVVDKVKNRVFDSNPLMLVDAMPVFDSDRLARFNPSHFQKLEILTRSFYLNEEAFPGVMSFTSYKNNFGNFPIPSNGIYLEYQGLSMELVDISQIFTPNEEDRVPDWRAILFWSEIIPDLTPQELKIHFPSIDLPWEVKVMYRDQNGKLETITRRISSAD
ncbi:hypothetical protein [Algoriphagus sediminis]|uniref:GWxTD domain-containing protein n=1 Tax=Algoriphagus sediminis TaxID=3057113 RepID=A0ABT7YGX7_9BACT|nr:hypothetical protein [Algoriphagus sediminis]MDN3205439.1 hypothetical protein [Algoriphagus sediminis]